MTQLNIAIAKNYVGMEDYHQAEKYALVAYNRATEGKDRRRLQIATEVLAQIYSSNGNKEKAIEYYKEFAELNSENKIKVRERKIAFDIARRVSQ